jgi:hypothetical protein
LVEIFTTSSSSIVAIIVGQLQDRIAILVAEGAETDWLGTLIAFAKGFLLPKISGSQSEDAAPTRCCGHCRIGS